MESKSPKVLIVEDNRALAEAYIGYLRNEPYGVSHVADGGSALVLLDEDPPDGLVLDLRLPDMNGMEVLEHIHRQRIPVSVVVITGYGSVDAAVEAMRYGAFDFIEKPFDAKRLQITLHNALEHRSLTNLVDRITEDFHREHFQGFIGGSITMQSVYRIIDSAAASKATVFITGESGSGKEVCAEAIHERSTRREKPFIPLNCAAIPRDLMETEIFGHVKGAFTGAVGERKGAAELADGGTLFLDEIGEMDLDLQSKLLRFVQTGSFQRVGDTRQRTVDVRFVCATNRDPLQLVEQGLFREDLYYRLHVIPVALPPLRERSEDVPALALHFLNLFSNEEGKRFRRFTEEAMAVLQAYRWPGNVRELQNVVRNVIVLNDGEEVRVPMLPPALSAKTAGPRHKPDVPESTAPRLAGAAQIKPLWLTEKAAIEAAIDACGGNIPRAAALLEVSPSTIYRKRQSWSQEPGA